MCRKKHRGKVIAPWSSHNVFPLPNFLIMSLLSYHILCSVVFLFTVKTYVIHRCWTNLTHKNKDKNKQNVWTEKSPLKPLYVTSHVKSCNAQVWQCEVNDYSSKLMNIHNKNTTIQIFCIFLKYIIITWFINRAVISVLFQGVWGHFK